MEFPGIAPPVKVENFFGFPVGLNADSDRNEPIPITGSNWQSEPHEERTPAGAGKPKNLLVQNLKNTKNQRREHFVSVFAGVDRERG